MEASYFKLNFHEGHRIGPWCHMGPKKASDLTLVNVLSRYLMPEQYQW